MTRQSSHRNCYCDRRNHHSTIRWWKNQSLFLWLNNKWRVDSLRQYSTTPWLNMQGLSRCALDGCLPPILIDWYCKMNESCNFVCSQGKLLMFKLFFFIWINIGINSQSPNLPKVGTNQLAEMYHLINLLVQYYQSTNTLRVICLFIYLFIQSIGLTSTTKNMDRRYLTVKSSSICGIA